MSDRDLWCDLVVAAFRAGGWADPQKVCAAADAVVAHQRAPSSPPPPADLLVDLPRLARAVRAEATPERLLDFGKYGAKTWGDVLRLNPGYLHFLVTSSVTECGDEPELWPPSKDNAVTALWMLLYGWNKDAEAPPRAAATPKPPRRYDDQVPF